MLEDKDFNAEVTWNHFFVEGVRVEHRVLKIKGTILVASVMSDQVLLRWDNSTEAVRHSIHDLYILDETWFGY